MFNIGITLLTALLLSSVAAYFSVVGLMAVFASAAIPIAIMGGTLELAKVVTASWVYRNWQTAPFIIRTYLTISVVVLSLITSLGIFGYLSKAHLDQAIPSGDIAARLTLIDEKIKVEKDNIDVNRKAVKQMDDSVDQVMGRSTDEKGADKAASLRKAQQKERYRLLNEIETYNKRVAALNEERAPIASEIRKVEAEVGPIKYIAALIYDTQSTDTLEKAVRWVIISLVLVFDPLAILLLIAANISLKQLKGEMITAVNRPKSDSFSTFDDPLTPIDPGPSTNKPTPVNIEPVPVQKVNEEEWSPEMYRRVRNEIPKEIMDKIFKK